MERTLPKVPPGPEGIEPWKRYARIVDGKLGDATRAAAAWQEVVERRPTDKEALEGLTRLARARGDWALLDDVLAAAAGARRRRRRGDGGARAGAARRRAAQDSERAIEILRHVPDELSPRNLEAHARLQKLLAGRRPRRQLAHRRARAVLDRGPRRQLRLRWNRLPRRWRGRAAASRTRGGRSRPGGASPTSAPTHRGASAGGAVPASERVRRCAGRREAPRAVGGGGDARRARASSCAAGDDRRGEAAPIPSAGSSTCASRTSSTPTRRFSAELRRVAERTGCGRDVRGLRRPCRASSRGSRWPRSPTRSCTIPSAPSRWRGRRWSSICRRRALLPELERLSVRANDAGPARRLRAAYCARLDDAKLALLRKRAEVREQRQKDPRARSTSCCARSRTRRATRSLLAEMRRLAEATRRWDDALAVEGYRFHPAPDD